MGLIGGLRPSPGLGCRPSGLASLGIGFSIKSSFAKALCLFFNSLALFFQSSFGNVAGVIELNFSR